jgi:hypothetical protein
VSELQEVATFDLGLLAAGIYTVRHFTVEVSAIGEGQIPDEPDFAFDLEVLSGTSRVSCDDSRCPGATLLIPYFEVDLKDPGRTTFFSLANADPDPVAVRTVLWTNWGIPVLGFDAVLAGDALLPIDLRRVLVSGQLPQTSLDEDETFAGCKSPALDAAALAALQARLSGQPDPDDGLCYSTTAGSPALATGYATIDTIQDCSQAVLYPGDEGYFDDRDDRVASDRNVLWGDVVLVDRSADRAEGFEAVSLIADTARFGPGLDREATFYGPPYFDHRKTIPTTYRSRFLSNDQLGTAMLIWTEGQVASRYPAAGPLACDTTPPPTYVGFIVHAGNATDGFRYEEVVKCVRPALATDHPLPVLGLTAPQPPQPLQRRLSRHAGEPVLLLTSVLSRSERAAR